MQPLKTRSLNLRQASGLLCSIVTLIVGLTISILTWQNLGASLQARFLSDVERESLNLSIALAPALTSQDRIRLNIMLSDWKTDADIYLVRVLTTDGTLLAEKGDDHSPKSHIKRLITQDQLVLGALEMDINPNSGQPLANRYLSLGLIATALVSLMAGILGYWLGGRLSSMIKLVSNSLIDTKSDNEKGPLPSSESYIQELDALVTQLNEQHQYRQKQQTLEQALNRFLYSYDKPVAGTSTYHRCAMFYIEIQDLDVLQARLSAEELAHCLSEYHRLLSQAAKLYNGRLDRYQGDGLVMTFGLNEQNERDTLHCLFAAWLSITLVQQAQQLPGSGLAPVSFRCAAHWGPVLLTPLRNEQDIADQYSLIGDSLYWTSHLARRGEEFRILVSQTLIENLPDDTDLFWTDGPQTQDLQGNHQTNFWLTALPETSQTLIDRQAQRILSMTTKA